MTEAVLQVIMGAVGTLGFALCFHVRGRHLIPAVLGGALAWICELAVFQGSGSLFFSNMVAAMAVCLWSEGAARLRKAPANTFLLPGIVPLLPGGMLYYTMGGLVNGDMAQFLEKGSETVFVAVGIAAGIVAASEIVNLLFHLFPGKGRAPTRRSRR